ncbi:uncharacterized protein TNCV_3751801 [Trichonephila clavipes]|nr:uncharacterized protein TNCV_3751801 [Trichonephila clavipes]
MPSTGILRDSNPGPIAQRPSSLTIIPDGGMRAVLWTDLFQALIMLSAAFAVCVKGTLDVGGLSEVWRIAEEGQRIQFFDAGTYRLIHPHSLISCIILLVVCAFLIPELHWCAKIKDEVEKLAYQLNEEAERTERPIRRLSKVIYGSTCADMQLDVMRECLSSIKHVVGVRSVFLAKRLHAV